MPYRHDLFISYASEDRAWATALHDALQARGVSCFLDALRLQPGRLWEPQLREALAESRHFVVLWSLLAKDSDWVSEEVVLFKQHAEEASQRKTPEQRLLFAINLDAPPRTTIDRFQGFVQPALQAAYAAGKPGMALDAAGQADWNAMLEEIAAGVRSDLVPQQVPVATLALTTSHLQPHLFAVPRLSFLNPGADIDVVLDALGVGPLAGLVSRYGPTVWDWKPGGTRTIAQMLEGLRSEARVGLNARLGQNKLAPVQWKQIDLLAPPEDELDDLARDTCKVPCVLVVDPLSLFNFDIHRRYIRLSPFFTSTNAAVMFPSLFDATASQSLLRLCLSAMGTPHLAWFHVPIPFRSDHAACGLNVADPLDLRRLVLASLGRSTLSDPFLHV